MRKTAFLIATLALARCCFAAELTLDQKLIVACFKLNVDDVAAALHDGADVNARFGVYDKNVFRDPQGGGLSPFGSNDWTPLLAAASARQQRDDEAAGDGTQRITDRNRVAATQRAARDQSRLMIAALLLAHGAAIDKDDGYGATALYVAVDEKKLDLAKLLLRCNANVNTKTGTYIDGPGGTTPLHRALWSAELVKLLLDHGADPQAGADGPGTAAEWMTEETDPEVRRLLPTTRVAATKPARDDAPDLAHFLAKPIEEWNDADELTIRHVGSDRLVEVLRRVASLKHLRTLTLSGTDFSRLPADLPVPPEVRKVTIGFDGFSQAAVDWLARFPSGTELSLWGETDPGGELDLRKLDLAFGEFGDVELHDCTFSPANVQAMVAKSQHVSFFDCHIDPPPATKPAE